MIIQLLFNNILLLWPWLIKRTRNYRENYQHWRKQSKNILQTVRKNPIHTKISCQSVWCSFMWSQQYIYRCLPHECKYLDIDRQVVAMFWWQNRNKQLSGSIAILWGKHLTLVNEGLIAGFDTSLSAMLYTVWAHELRSVNFAKIWVCIKNVVLPLFCSVNKLFSSYGLSFSTFFCIQHSLTTA